MKLRKVIVSVTVFLAVVIVVAAAVIAHFAKPFVVDQLEKNLKVKTRVDQIRFGFPLSITLVKLELGDFASFERISVFPSLWGIFAGKIVLNKVDVIRPVITIVRSPDGSIAIPQPAQKGNGPAVVIAGFSMSDGVVTFIDKTVSDPGYALVLESVNIDISRASVFPGSQKILCAVSAKAGDVKNKSSGVLTFSGWMDFVPKD
ncbi:MAG: hypothetical protein PHC33_05925, partial [Candidatus Omnitrophica bacterium]|nr:hypothetical protein [Candidatus Omnitrophota bacterium]